MVGMMCNVSPLWIFSCLLAVVARQGYALLSFSALQCRWMSFPRRSFFVPTVFGPRTNPLLLRDSQRRSSLRATFEESAGYLHSAINSTASDDFRFSNAQASGLYRPIADMIWKRLQGVEGLKEGAVPKALQNKEARSKGGGESGRKMITRIETRSMVPESPSFPVRYVRMALLETIPGHADPIAERSAICTDGVQVLNVLIIPNMQTRVLPVWGADFVSLPPNKHLLLLDAQPMNAGSPDIALDSAWSDWYQRHDIPNNFPWGGDLPDPVKQYVSLYALWSRFGGGASKNTREDGISLKCPFEQIQTNLFQAVESHLDVYLHLLLQEEENVLDHSTESSPVPTQHPQNPLEEYLQYRLKNDPARPMLKALFGEEWTEQVLHQVLFPPMYPTV